jgi:hypothetical protein
VSNFVQFLLQFLQLRIKLLTIFILETSEHDKILPIHVELCENFSVSTNYAIWGVSNFVQFS